MQKFAQLEAILSSEKAQPATTTDIYNMFRDKEKEGKITFANEESRINSESPIRSLLGLNRKLVAAGCFNQFVSCDFHS